MAVSFSGFMRLKLPEEIRKKLSERMGEVDERAGELCFKVVNSNPRLREYVKADPFIVTVVRIDVGEAEVEIRCTTDNPLYLRDFRRRAVAELAALLSGLLDGSPGSNSNSYV